MQYKDKIDLFLDDFTCQLGKQNLKVGEEVIEIVGAKRPKAVCLCEVPPIPTCVKIPFFSDDSN